MSTKFDRLTEQYDSLSVGKKKQFIENYKRQLQTDRSSESLRFFNECIRKYNNEVRAHFSASSTPVNKRSAATPTKYDKPPEHATPTANARNLATLRILLIIETVIILAGLTSVFVMFFKNEPEMLSLEEPSSGHSENRRFTESFMPQSATPLTPSSEPPTTWSHSYGEGVSGFDPTGHVDSMGTVALLYHHIADTSDDNMTVSTAQFEAQMLALYESGYSSLSMQDIHDYVHNDARLPERTFVITFDDGYLSTYEIAFPILKKYGFQATIFVIGVTFGRNTYKDGMTSIIPRFNETQALEMIESGLISIQSHSYDMHQLSPYDANPREGLLQRPGEWDAEYISVFTHDFYMANNLIYRITGEGIIAFAYPYGLYDKLSASLLERFGVRITFITEPGVNTLIRNAPSSLLELRRYQIDDLTTPDELVRILTLAR